MTYDEAMAALADCKFVRRASWPEGRILSPFRINSYALKVTQNGPLLVNREAEGWTARSWKYQQNAPGQKEATDWEVVDEEDSGWPFLSEDPKPLPTQ
jgi:hypothetical protein